MQRTFPRHTVEQVTDADTYVLEDGRCIRLFGVDAPETYPIHQPYGKAATEFSENLLGAHQNKVYVDERTEDKYGRTVARLLLGSPEEGKGTDLSLVLLNEGYAWAYRRYLKKDPLEDKYIEAEEIAKQSRLGLWKDENPVNPSDFRKKNRKHKKTPKVKTKKSVGGKYINDREVGVIVDDYLDNLDKENNYNVTYDDDPPKADV